MVSNTGDELREVEVCDLNMDTDVEARHDESTTAVLTACRAEIENQQRQIFNIALELHYHKQLLTQSREELERVKLQLADKLADAEQRMRSVRWLRKVWHDNTAEKENMKKRVKELEDLLETRNPRRSTIVQSPAWDLMSCTDNEKCVLREGWTSYNSQDDGVVSVCTSDESICDLLTFSHDYINMILRDPLGVPFYVTYTDGVLRYVQYMPGEDSQTMCNDWKRRSGHDKETHFSSEAESPDGGKDVERPDEENLNDAGCGDVEQGMGDAEPSARLQQGMGGAKPSARLEQGMGGVKPSARLEQGMGGAEPSARLKEKMGGAEPSARSNEMMREKTKKQNCGVSKGNGKAPAVGDIKIPSKQKIGVAKRRRRPGKATLAEIRHLQRTVHLCLPFKPFLRLVREIVNKDVAPGRGMRFELVGMRALLKAVEAYLVHLMENTNELAIHVKRVTINVKDMRLADALWKPRWAVVLKGVQDKRRAEEERVRRREERTAGRTSDKSGTSKRKGVPHKGNASKKT
ncbi:hypothetical protein CBR_g28510 [Chara braunii]|uniref:Core Histone H2A/H2B/H3 domain-containing protein n=1 Tax=Chara braunii TaxID=69332 RepID=A0A388JW36_CHABU|nr:hypothetical protein CBR_g28510 [Chara braunii]|eukprot:GBG62034.1 hypothetical protein CBR_g28510 [Chara braunii]